MITVFYEVNPEDLNGKFADDLRRHEGSHNRWRTALERLETTDPKFCSRNWEDDSKMLDDVITSVSSPRFQLSRVQNGQAEALVIDVESGDLGLMSTPKSLSTQHERYAHQDTSFPTNDTSMDSPFPASDDSSIGLVGMYRHKKAVYALLDLESSTNVRTVGIWGLQGVGKTTLVERIYEDLSQHFQHHCFLSNNVSNSYQYRTSPSLLQHLTERRSSDNIFDAIKPSLVNRKVLIVVDGVDSRKNEQFTDAKKVTRWLGPGSRVIMTSRFESELKFCGVKYEMECLRYEEALQLFSLFAFKKTYPLIGFEGLSVRAVQFAGRLPLALKVLGSFLYEKDEESWKRTLRKLETSLDNGSRQVSNYIGACEYLPRRQTELEHYVGVDEEKQSPSYHMLL